jgi:hypothetical protein
VPRTCTCTYNHTHTIILIQSCTYKHVRCVVHAHTIIQRTCSWGHERRGKLCMTQGLSFFDGRDVHSDIRTPPHRMPRTPRSYIFARAAPHGTCISSILFLLFNERFVKYQVRGLLKLCPFFTLFSRVCTTTPYELCKDTCTITMRSGTRSL